jgi:hypothetical protein
MRPDDTAEIAVSGLTAGGALLAFLCWVAAAALPSLLN